MSVVAGFDGYFKVGHWFPIQVEVSNSGTSIEGELVYQAGDPAFGDVISYSTPLSLPTQSNKIVTLYVNSGNKSGHTVKILTDNGAEVLSQTLSGITSLPLDALLYGVVSSDGGELAYLERITGSASTAQVAFFSLDSLPETAVSFNNLDILIFNDVDTTQLTSAQLSALNSWIETGGQFVVTGGNGWEKTVTAVNDLLPVTPTGSETFADLPAFNQQIGIPFRDQGPYLLTTSTIRTGELIYHEDGLPILATQQLGQGRVYFLAIDPRTAPLLDWDGTELLWDTIVNAIEPQPFWQYPIQDTGSAIEAVSSLPDVRLPAVWQLLVFLLAYILLMGPINYIVLKRRNQLDRAWVTIPVIVLLFSLGTYFVGANLRGQNAIVNQLSLAVSSAQADEAQVQTLIGLYAPQRGEYDMSIPGDVAIRPLTPGYFGFGTNNTSIEKITLGEETAVNNMRLDVGEVATFITQSTQPAIRIGGEATLETNEQTIVLTVNIQNNSQQTLENALLLLGHYGIDVGEIPPGDSKQIVETFTQATLTRNGFGTTGSSSFSPSGSPLSNNLNTLLGSFNYYSDPILYPRWQLIQALESNYNTNFLNQLTLVFWTDGPGLETTLNRGSTTSNVTLHFVDMPLETNLADSNAQFIPASFLDWTVIESNNVFSPQPNSISFGGNSASVAFEFSPLADELQSINIESLTINVETPSINEPFPRLQLWDWDAEIWVELDDADWGDTAVTNPTPYIGSNNAVRIRLVDQSSFGIYLSSVYPFMTNSVPEN